ncbi:MAG: hypothetical protein ACLQVL_32250 [Terriglobia bacterium]
MESRRLAPLVITLFAALAVFYPITTATRSAERNSEPAKYLTGGKSESSEEAPASTDFPTAKDLVSQFFFSRQGNQPTPSSQPPEDVYSIDFLIATVPDPVSSRLPHFFDSFAESMESAAEASGYTLERFALPWPYRGKGPDDNAPSWHQALYESVPGLILFRNPQDRKLLLIFLIGETPTTGIYKQAMFSALDQMAQFYPWDPKHGNLPQGFPRTTALGPVDTFPIMGPAFSGSGVSLRFVLDQWSESRSNLSKVRFQIISGTATAIDAGWLAQAAQGHASFQATVPPDDETLQAIACYIDRLGYSKIAILTEGNTAYGQNFTKQSAAGGKASRGGCGNGLGSPEILSLPFPMNISRLRVAASSVTPQQEPAGSGTSSGNPLPRHLAQEKGYEPREVLPSFSDLTVQSAELTLSNLLSTIAREQFSYVGIVATDVRDVTFLAHEVRQHCPATVLFTLNSDLLYAYPDVNSATRGMIIITPYPLFNLEQLWTYAYGGGKSRLQFSNQAAEGVYNATLALLHQDGKLVDYGSPLAVSANPRASEQHKPSLWVTTIGNGETLPVRILGWKDDRNYTYSPVPSTDANKPSGRSSVGRGIYAENSVVALIALSILISALALLIVGQYWRPEKRGAGLISTLLGDTASPAYWSEGRLFILCCCMSLLSFYVVLVTAFCLPFMAGKALNSSIQTTATPKVAAVIAMITTLLLLLATMMLVSAFRKARSEQRGAAPEVVLFALFACALVFVLAGLLAMAWLATAKANPASGLFNHLRAFDFRGGLSPLLPLSCVAVGACLWGLCSFRRLRVIDVLRATGTAEKPHSWLSFVSLEVRSFNGVRELENNVKHVLESSSVISLTSYLLLVACGFGVGHYFFATRLVRAFEPRPFYWLFEAAFIIVYWALLMEFLRLVFAWRSLQMLLERLSWHPLLAAFKRYREGHPGIAKMDLNHPPSSFAVLESSVDQAGRLVRAAKELMQARDTDEDLREVLWQSIPQWEEQVQDAGSHLCEALRLQWTDDSRAATPSLVETIQKKRASRIKGNWRQSLKFRCHAHHALFRLLQSLEKPMERYWSCIHADGAATAPASAAKEFFDQVEEFLAGRLVNFLAIVFPSLQNLGYFVLAGLLLMLLAVTSYPFQPRNEFLFFNWVVILSFIGTVCWIFVQMDRDTILSLLNDTKPGEVTFSRALVLRAILYVGVPFLALLGAQFPESLRQILSLFTAAPGSP